MSNNLRPRVRLFVEDRLTSGASIDLPQGQAHYLGTVMRAKAGEPVALFNGRDGEWSAEITSLSRKGAGVRIGSRRRAQASEPDLWLLFAPLKKTETDFVVEKATELGVSLLWPTMTKNTNSTRVNVERLRLNAVEAAEQCERLTVPEVREPETLERLLAEWDPARQMFIMDETGGGKPVYDVLRAAPDNPAAVLVGPEGGFSKSELDLLRQTPFVTSVGLGPRILRAETAALAALSCWQAIRGDWQARPSFRSLN